MITKEERKPNNISRVATRALLFNHWLQRGINTEEELRFYIREFLGFVVPTHAVCSHHVAPWQALSDIFFERKHSTFLFGSRSSGKTRMLSLLNNCVTGDTKIQCPRDYVKYPGGIPIKDLVGKEFWVYSYDLKTNKLVLSWAKDVGLRRKQVPVYKVTYDWKGYKGQSYSDSIRATGDHEFLLFSGQYKPVHDLKKGDSLLAFSENKDSDGYVHLSTASLAYSNIKLTSVKASRFIWEQVTGIKLPPKTHVHHKNCNESDNNFDNLLPLTDSQHQFFHWKVLKTQPSLDEGLKKLMVEKMIGVEPFWFDKDWLLDQYVVRSKSGNQIAKEFGTSAVTISSWIKRHGIPLRSVSAQISLSHQVSQQNHRVTSVVFDGFEDVYCMEVEGTHNFMTSHICIKNCEATFKPKIQICNAGAIITQAQRNYEYTLSYYEDDLLASTLKNSIQSHTELTNGSVISVISGSMRGFNGAHPCKLRLDEIELIDWYSIQEAFSMTQSTDTWQAQDTLSSTRKFSFGSVQRLLEEAKERAITVYPWCLVGRMKVRTSQGDYAIRDLVGKEFCVYSYHESGELVLRRAKHVRRTRKKAKVYKIVYEWWAGPQGGKKIGEMICTGDHRILMRDGSYKEALDLRKKDSLMPFYKKKNENIKNFDRYYEVGFTGSKTQRESRFVWEQLRGPIPSGYVIHHKDGDDFNNDLSNLELILRSEHSKEHTQEWWNLSSQSDIESRNKKISDFKKEEWDELSEKEKEVKRDYCRKLFIGSQGNHKVVSVEFYGHEDVYDLEVEETHNFACEDIFVHNCIWESLEQCTRECFNDPVFGDCPIYSKKNVKTGKEVKMCGGMAHKCVVGSTLIDMPRDLVKYPDGIPIKDLVGREFQTYGFDIKSRKVVLRKAKHVRLIHKNERTIKVKFGWYKGKTKNKYVEDFIIVTPDHRFLLRDGTYRRADELVTGDRLQSFNRRFYKKQWKNKKKGLYSSLEISSRNSIPEHCFIVGELEGRGVVYPDEVVHHKNFIPLDNTPDNLCRMTTEGHRKFHADHSLNNMIGDSNPMRDLGNVEKCRRSNLKAWSSPGGRKRREKLSESSQVRAERVLKSSSSTPRQRQYARKVLGIKLSKSEISQSVSAGIRKIPSEVLSSRQRLNVSKRWVDHEKFESLVCDHCEVVFDALKTAKRSFCSRECASYSRVGEGNPNYKNGVYCQNHTVLSVTESDPEDVYCMEVEGVHNFVASGVFVENCRGWYPVNDLIKKIRLLDVNTWKAQWLCEKTGDSSTVYGEFFSEEAHVLKTEEEFMAKFQELEGEPMTPRHRRVSGVDFGGQFAFVRLVKSPTNRRRFYILEVYFSRSDVTLDTHIAKIKKLMWWGQGREVIFGDSAARQDIIEFNTKGIPVHLAVKEIFNGINLVKSLLETQEDGKPGIYVNGSRCEALINEFGSYSYKIRKDGLPDLDSIFKERDHCLDALRYALFTHVKGGGRVKAGRRRNF